MILNNWDDLRSFTDFWYPESGYKIDEIELTFFRKENWCVFRQWTLREILQWKHHLQEVQSDHLIHRLFRDPTIHMKTSNGRHQFIDAFQIQLKRSFWDKILQRKSKDKNKDSLVTCICYERSSKSLVLIHYSSFSGLAISLAAEKLHLTDINLRVLWLT